VAKSRILVVNDAPAINVFIGLILKNQGFDSVLADNGMDALKKLDENHIDLVITDLNMPEMDGYELTKKIRSHYKYRFIPIIFLTGGDKSDVYNRAKEAGSTAFINVPFERERLIKIIRTLIR
jgi:CheY-like chemotaxis protein